MRSDPNVLPNVLSLPCVQKVLIAQVLKGSCQETHPDTFSSRPNLAKKLILTRMALPLFSWVLWRFCSDQFSACLIARFGE